MGKERRRKRIGTRRISAYQLAVKIYSNSARKWLDLKCRLLCVPFLSHEGREGGKLFPFAVSSKARAFKPSSLTPSYTKVGDDQQIERLLQAGIYGGVQVMWYNCVRYVWQTLTITFSKRLVLTAALKSDKTAFARVNPVTFWKRESWWVSFYYKENGIIKH
jgi:hypothetical protein